MYCTHLHTHTSIYTHGTYTQYLRKVSHFSYKVDGEKVVFLLSQVVLHQSILIVTHQAQHLGGINSQSLVVKKMRTIRVYRVITEQGKKDKLCVPNL